MNEKLSSWVDGELDTEEAGRMLNSLAKSDTLRTKSEAYWLIGDTLREEPQLSHDFCDRVMAAINEEPTVLSPVPVSVAAPLQARQQAPSRWLSIAAAGAGVAVVGWMAYSFNKPEQAAQDVATTQNDSGSQLPMVDIKPAVAQPASSELNGDRAYVVAHQPYGGVGGVSPGAATYTPPVKNEQQTEPKK